LILLPLTTAGWLVLTSLYLFPIPSRPGLKNGGSAFFSSPMIPNSYPSGPTDEENPLPLSVLPLLSSPPPLNPLPYPSHFLHHCSPHTLIPLLHVILPPPFPPTARPNSSAVSRKDPTFLPSPHPVLGRRSCFPSSIFRRAECYSPSPFLHASDREALLCFPFLRRELSTLPPPCQGFEVLEEFKFPLLEAARQSLLPFLLPFPPLIRARTARASSSNCPFRVCE